MAPPKQPPVYTATSAQKTNPLTRWLVIGGAAAVVIAAVVAIIASSGGDKKGSGGAVVAEMMPVTVDGSVLPPLDAQAASDIGVGLKAPKLTGKSFDGTPITINPGSDGKLMVVFVAHWCPHCQAEVPRLVKWIAAGKPPKDLRIVAVATGTRADQPNFPPSAWLARESWPKQVMADNSEQPASKSYGLDGYPYFVLINSDGTVSSRQSGEIAMEALDALVAKLT